MPFSRPRSFDVERTGEFAQLRARIWDLLREDVRIEEESA